MDVFGLRDRLIEDYSDFVKGFTRLDPPPGPPCDENDRFIPTEQWDPDNWPPHIHRPKGWKRST